MARLDTDQRSAAQNAAVSVIQAGSCRDRHRSADRLSQFRGVLVLVQIEIPPCGGDEVVNDVDRRCRGLEMWEVSDTGEHLKSTAWQGVVSGVAMGDRNDPVLLAPNQQGGQSIAEMILLSAVTAWPR